ncbi:MAG TPA: FtsK/SpoIIIE domain-containing protein, partial [Virgibacillus sp.]|nr:FtsK/SpoIIIE domain-containing protein [Virgibacillus sp.]
MAGADSSGNKNNDEVILHVIGVAAGVLVGLLVLLSFLPAIILAAVITIGIVWANKKQWLNYALYVSIAAFVVLILTGTWQEAFQLVFLPFELFSLEQFVPRLEKALNNGDSFQPGILTYLYFIIFAIAISRIAIYFHEQFQSRIVHSKKDEKAKEKETLQYQKVEKNRFKLNAKTQRSWRQKQFKKERINQILLGINQLGDPFKISYDELKQHTLAVGTTGSGKTTALYSPLETALKNKDGFVMIDGKGDPETIEQVQSLFDAYGRKLHVFHSSKKLTYNPLKNGGHTAGTNHLFNAFDWSEQFYKNVTKEHTQ